MVKSQRSIQVKYSIVTRILRSLGIGKPQEKWCDRVPINLARVPARHVFSFYLEKKINPWALSPGRPRLLLAFSSQRKDRHPVPIRHRCHQLSRSSSLLLVHIHIRSRTESALAPVAHPSAALTQIPPARPLPAT
jgi:hypothetical protein